MVMPREGENIVVGVCLNKRTRCHLKTSAEIALDHIELLFLFQNSRIITNSKSSIHYYTLSIHHSDVPFLLHISVDVHWGTRLHICDHNKKRLRRRRGGGRTTKEIGWFEGFVAAHEDVEMDVGLGKGGQMWVLVIGKV